MVKTVNYVSDSDVKFEMRPCIHSVETSHHSSDPTLTYCAEASMRDMRCSDIRLYQMLSIAAEKIGNI